MVAWGPAIRTAVKVAPIAIEVARQLDRQLRPHVLAYRAAREVDGYVGRWTDDDGTHWLVFSNPTDEPLRAFPPLRQDEAELAAQQVDRSTLTHHTDLPEARAGRAVTKLVPGRGSTGSSPQRRPEDDDGGETGPPPLPA